MFDAVQRIRAWVERRGDLIAVIVSAVIIVVFGVSMAAYAADDHPLSYLDEHVHFDTQLKLHEGELSHRGAFYEEGVVEEWACGVGHEAGGLVHGCGDPALDVRDVTSGRYTTGYIHYPTYFALAEAFRWVVDSTVGPFHDLTTYRLASAFFMTLGVAAVGTFAYLLRIRGIGLIASVSIPAAATSMVVMAGMVTPNSTALLAGALVAGTGFLWIRRGRGFLWLALAASFASMTAVVNSLSVGGFMFAILIVWLRNRRRMLEQLWRPRLWHLLTLAAIILLPVILWGRYIAATATVSNADIYGAYEFAGWRPIVVGAVQELFALHSPWTEWAYAVPAGSDLISQSLRAIAVGAPFWVSVLVIGGVIFASLGVSFRPQQEQLVNPETGTTTRAPVSAERWVALGTLITMVLYPVALRISNAITFGIDYPIVSRYSMAFAPVLVLVLLLLTEQRRVRAILAVVGVIALAGCLGL